MNIRLNPRCACALAAIVLLLVCTSSLFAGQGPQNVMLAINSRSWASLAVGHHYVRLRNIPEANVVYLDWDGSPIGTDVETFRQKILGPILKTIQDRHLAGHITTIAYSSDFPYVIDFAADIPADAKLDPRAKRFTQGSLTGMTYLAPLVLSKNLNYANLGANFYYRPNLEDKLLLPTRGFTPGKQWSPQGEPVDKEGLRYFLSTMIGYTSGRGNSVEEVEHYLRRGIVADGTYPQGKIYFLKNGDVRAKTREPNFAPAIELLDRLGVAAEVVEGVLPKDRGDVMGGMLGTVDYRFADSGSSVRGGAIVENLTSFGGILREDGGQTALSEALRAGAAGSSGTVTEPFAIQAKFPHPMLHVHYASGSSLAEAFYQAVHGPYQLLVVGDPLCRPWATIPTIRVEGLPNEGAIKGRLKLTPSARLASGKAIKKYELYVDGRLGTQCPAGDTLEIDTSIWADGWHELRIVGYEDSLIETQGELVAGVISDNHAAPAEATLSVVNKEPVTLDGEVTLRASSGFGGSLMLYQNQRLLGVLASDNGSWTLPARVLGLGRSTLHVLAMRGQGAANSLISPPLVVDVLPPPQIAAEPAAVGERKPGLVARVGEGEEKVVERLSGDWLEKLAAKEGEKIAITGVFDASSAGLYQLQFDAAADIELSISGQKISLSPQSPPCYVPLQLAAGQHRLELRFPMPASKRLNVAFGSQGASVIAAPRFGH